MPKILRILLAIALSISLSSCQLIGSLIGTALRLAPLALLAENESAQGTTTKDIEARGRKIQVAPVYDGRIDWMKKDSTAPQGLAAR